MFHGGVKGDISELMMVGGGWFPLLAIKLGQFNEILATIGIIMAIAASGMAVVDHSMKISWKIKESKKKKHGGTEHRQEQ